MLSKKMSRLLMGFMSLATASLALIQPATAESLIHQGALEVGDAVLPADGSLYDTYPFRGQSGQQVEITMESADFDTYLILLDPDGNVIAENDDANQSHSALRQTLPVGGTYTIIANSYDYSLGRYRLVVSTLERGSAPPSISRSCQSAVNSVLDHLGSIDNLQVYARTGNASEGHPSSRPESFQFVMQGSAITSVMDSSQLLTTLSTSMIQNCESVSQVSFAQKHSGWRISFGLFSDNQVKAFQCAEDFGMQPGSYTGRVAWGMEFCSI